MVVNGERALCSNLPRQNDLFIPETRVGPNLSSCTYSTKPSSERLSPWHAWGLGAVQVWRTLSTERNTILGTPKWCLLCDPMQWAVIPSRDRSELLGLNKTREKLAHQRSLERTIQKGPVAVEQSYKAHFIFNSARLSLFLVFIVDTRRTFLSCKKP